MCAGQPRRWIVLWTSWGAAGRLLWISVGNTCEFPSSPCRNGGLGWPAFTHRLWTEALFGAAVFVRSALGSGAFQLGHVEFVLARDKAVRVVKVLRGRQQVGVGPDRVPAFDAARLGEAPPDRGGLPGPAPPDRLGQRAGLRQPVPRGGVDHRVHPAFNQRQRGLQPVQRRLLLWGVLRLEQSSAGQRDRKST